MYGSMNSNGIGTLVTGDPFNTSGRSAGQSGGVIGSGVSGPQVHIILCPSQGQKRVVVVVVGTENAGLVGEHHAEHAAQPPEEDALEDVRMTPVTVYVVGWLFG